MKVGTLAKETKSKKRGASQRLFTHYPKDLNCEVFRVTKTTQARCEKKDGKTCGWDSTFDKIW